MATSESQSFYVVQQTEKHKIISQKQLFMWKYGLA
jgi:hypothetical protein